MVRLSYKSLRILAINLLFLANCHNYQTVDKIALEKYKYANKLYAQGKYKEAIENYTYTIKKRPLIMDAYYRISACYEYLKQYHKAIYYLQIAQKIDPKDLYVLNNLVRLYVHTGMREDAINTLKELLLLLPEGEQKNEVKKEIERLRRIKR
jgi:tetratricopeptide (TPR) repeat protein